MSGNAARTVSEITRLPSFEHFSFIRKIGLCIGSPIVKYMVVTWQSLIVWAFSIILPLTIFLKNKKAYIPLLVSLIPFGLLLYSVIKFNPVFTILHETTASQLTFICAISVAFYGSIFFSLFYIGKNEESIIAKYGPLFIFFVGFTTRACLGITISFLEMARTFFLLEYAMIAISILLMSRNISNWIDKPKKTDLI